MVSVCQEGLQTAGESLRQLLELATVPLGVFQVKQILLCSSPTSSVTEENWRYEGELWLGVREKGPSNC